MQGYTGRLALILHCLNASVDGCLPAEGVSAQTMTTAIKLTRWFIGQVKLLYAEGDTVERGVGAGLYEVDPIVAGAGVAAGEGCTEL